MNQAIRQGAISESSRIEKIKGFLMSSKLRNVIET